MSTLVQLISDSQNIVNKLVESGGELTDELSLVFEANEKDLALKVDNYVSLFDTMETNITLYKEKAAQFSRAAKTLDNSLTRLKEHLKNTMLSASLDQLEGQSYRVKLSHTKPKIEIYDESLLPTDFYREVIKYEPDKEKIREALDSGLEVPGARMIESYSLRDYVK